jgi:hypothetical protein
MFPFRSGRFTKRLISLPRRHRIHSATRWPRWQYECANPLWEAPVLVRSHGPTRRLDFTRSPQAQPHCRSFRSLEFWGLTRSWTENTPCLARIFCPVPHRGPLSGECEPSDWRPGLANRAGTERALRQFTRRDGKERKPSCLVQPDLMNPKTESLGSTT